MDLLRNILSHFQKSLQKTGNASNTQTKEIIHSPENISLKQPVDITNNILQSEVHVEFNVNQEINVGTDKNIVKKLSKEALNGNTVSFQSTDSKNTKENVQKTSFIANKGENSNKNASDLMKRLFNNPSVSIKKVQPIDTQNNNKQRKDVNFGKEFVNVGNRLVTDAPFFNSKNNNKNYLNNTAKIHIKLAKNRNMALINKVKNTASFVASKSLNNNSSKKNADDQTKKCLKEFDDILAKVQIKNNCKLNDTEAYSLAEIDNILNEELEDTDSTYNFQKIKHINDVDSKQEMKIGIDSNDIVVGQILETVITRLHNEIAAKVAKTVDEIAAKETVEDNVDIISLSSDDTPIRDVENSTNLEVTKKKTIEKCKETDQSKNFKLIENINENIKENNECVEETDKIETISISSDDIAKCETDDDCGYHSSDFEFITEEEAKIDGFIINFNPERHILSKNLSRNSNKNKNRIRKDFHKAGPSRNVGRFESNKRNKNAIADKSYMENYAVPQENEFLNMFHGIIPAMPPSEIHFLENKSVRTRAPMLVQYEGVGFDMNLAMQRVDSSDDEYRDEAEESLKKILEMYPDENTKRKRRRRR